MQARSTFVKSEAMLGIVETEAKSQKERVLTTGKTIWTVVSRHKTIAPAELWLSSGFDNDEI